ncbi:Na+/H+ antiporter [Pedobacter psychrodurus]|uniref:Na+/H+ antiporter n=1 Tax=Pedobacter psychrodurus TaxID=2530456 RepID=A0A4R0PZV8_9SPHI|nr:Na+/H+ antiporter [Pedobacter psychrodurus]TCD28801.1 Na+/H+ antiporter [Pedobacter psychrodurus]
MHENLLLILGMLFLVILLVMLAQKMRIAYPIFLVLAGLLIGFIPGMPILKLDPELIFLIFLPPLLYEAAWYTSWREFKKWKIQIGLMAFGLVLLTSVIVAFASILIIPGFTLALGFVLGGIISPPDAVAATTVLKGLKVPQRTITILEGESLVNDASSLIIFRFALAAILTGSFTMHQAVGQFFLVAGMGIAVGIAGGYLMYIIHRFMPTSAAIDATLTLMTPYILFLTAEHFHYSGVMAVVSGGLFMSFRAHEVFKTGETRMNMISVWHTVIFAMNAIVFILIGLELPVIVSGLGNISIINAIKYGVIISLIAVCIRILWVYLIAFFPRWISKKKRQSPAPALANLFIIGWAGMRGVVSLATALSIPLLIDGGKSFPQRDLIIFITFVVIFITLVFQGLSLPVLIKLTKVTEIDPILPQHEQNAGIRMRLDIMTLQCLSEHHSEASKNNSLLSAYTESLYKEIEGHQRYLTSNKVSHDKAIELEEYRQVMRKVHEMQREELFKMKNEKTFTDDAIRKAENLLDLNDIKLSGI